MNSADNQPIKFLRPVVSFTLKAAVGFFVGVVLAYYFLVFTGALIPHSDLNSSEIVRNRNAYRLVLLFGLVFSIPAAVLSHRKVSRFWLWFVLAFGAICVLPCLPFKGGVLLPLGTPYVNYGFQRLDLVILIFHVLLSLGIASAIDRFMQTKKVAGEIQRNASRSQQASG
ncbi:hypothetical protein [Calycomorphotria hydatis]|uniref:Uncharacterized protein n=1 Tax=Calycomorphotria hydatis TaxID=2528027 RepID=A0A517T611_9PLAN|nr:hypothetical protein [Calycomorphotria hydatis]QDT63803.1 hypothetical protein V22_10280 [Calycomorphotria hydatis]